MLTILEQRFWSKVNKDGPIPHHCPELGNCWVWTGAKNKPNGYGQFFSDGSLVQAHVWVYKQANPNLKRTDLVLHKCDNRACVRLSHLFHGPHLTNMRDMRLKGRSNSGNKNTNAKLTPDNIVVIRFDYHTNHKTCTNTAKEYAVSRQCISSIIHGLTWAVEVGD